MTRVLDVMTREVRTVPHNATVQEAAEKMKVEGIGSLPILRDGRLIGTLTDRDITIRLTAEGRDPRMTLVREVMSPEVVTVRPQQELSEAEVMMHNQQVRRLPVVDSDGRVVGYLTLATIAQRTGDEMVLAALLRGISQPSKPSPDYSSFRQRGRSGG